MKNLLLLFSFLSLVTQLFSQTEVDEKSVIDFKEGLGFNAPDTSFGVHIRFRMQNMISATTQSDNDFHIKEIDARVRRLRLRLDGYIRDFDITYYLQLAFSLADQDFERTHKPNIIRDAIIYYHFNHDFYMGFGQSKLPGNRERIISSGNLQFPDRSIANSYFNIDRDFGIFAYYTLFPGVKPVNLKGAITTGEGRSPVKSDDGLAYTGRIEFLPLGQFTNSGDFSEGDLEGEKNIKVAVATAYSFNQRAIRTAGQFGYDLYEPRDMKSWYTDVVFKYLRFAYMAEYMWRDCKNPVTFSDTLYSYVYPGSGMNHQISYMFKNKYELAARFSFVNPGSKIAAYENTIENYAIGVNKYFVKHKGKIQGLITYKNIPSDPSKNDFTFVLQVELGI